MKLLMTVLAVALSLQVVANDNGSCKIDFRISDDGQIVGKTNSQDLNVQSHYFDFATEDDDGFITQTIVLKKILADNKGLQAPVLTTEDSYLLLKSIDRAISYSTNPKVLNNPKLKPADKENLGKVAEFNKQFKEIISKSRMSKKISLIDLQKWRSYMEEQRYEHYFTLHGSSAPVAPTKGVVNLCGGYPKSVPECCKFKIAELNNVLAMSLCSTNFATGERVDKVFSENKSKCSNYKIGLNRESAFDAAIKNTVAPYGSTKQ